MSLPHIVLVEDHADTRQMYAEFLSLSFEVLQASDGREALALMRERAPALVITDLSLPGMDGFELIRLMRDDDRLRSVPVICLSGYGGHAHEQRAREVGCDHIQKPYLPDALATLAESVVRDRAGAG